MESPMFDGELVHSSRILYTPSPFARTNLLHLQEVGSLQARRPHASARQGLASYLVFLVESGSGTLEYIPFPDVLRGKYQSYTQADTTKLLEAGYDGGFTDIDEAVAEYCALLDKTGGYYKYEA